MIVFPDLGKQVSYTYICSTVVVTCMWVDGEPENQGNKYNRYVGLMFYNIS